MDKRKKLFFLLPVVFVVAFLSVSCEKDEEIDPEYEPVVYEMAYRYRDVVKNGYFELTHSNVQTPPEHQLESSSGLVTGRSNPGIVYICQGQGFRSHHPQSHPAELYVYDKKAVYQGKIIVEGSDNVNWQDLAIGPGPVEGVNYIYIGDIGDKDASRPSLTIYRIPEPDLGGLQKPFEKTVSDVDAIEYTIPEPRDAETLMIDPVSKDLIVMAKMQAFIYRIPYPHNTAGVTEAWYKGHHSLRREIKAGDISPDGSQIIIKDVGEIFLWEVADGEDPVEVMFTVPPTISEYAGEPEGGALGWTSDGNRYFTITDTDMAEDETRRAEPILFGYSRK